MSQEIQEECLFCKIAKGDEARKVYEGEETVAFLDINPTSHGHTLVIPKDHFENIYTLPAEALCRMILTVQKLSTAIKEVTEADGINIVMNNEPAANQAIFHAHIHVIPRHEGDVFPHWPHKPYIGDEAEVMAEKIKADLEK
jgi:histidine triad (HIT) family protein